MKLFTIAILSLLLSSSTTDYVLNEGQIHYSAKIDSEKKLTLETQMQIDAMEINLFFGENVSRLDWRKAEHVLQSTIINYSTGDGVFLLMATSAIVSKSGANFNINDVEWEDYQERVAEVTFTDQTKTILGYSCKHCTTTDLFGFDTEVWYTEEINFNKKGLEPFSSDMVLLSEKVPGTPLEFTTRSPGTQTKIRYTATEISEKISGNPTELFSTEIPEGYRKPRSKKNKKVKGN